MKAPLAAMWVYKLTDKRIQFSDDFIKMFQLDKIIRHLSIDNLLDQIVTGPEIEKCKKSLNDFVHAPYQFGKTLNLEFTKKNKSGEIKYFKKYIFYKSEHEIIAFIEDITKNKTKEYELLNANKNLEAISGKLEGIIDNTKNGVAIFRAIENANNFIYTGLNKAGSELDEITKEEVFGRKISDVLPGAYEFGLIESLKNVWETGKPEILPLKQYNDGRISGWREYYIFKIKTGEVVVVYSDLSDSIVNQREASKYKTAVEQSANSIVITDIEGKIEYVNKSFCNLYGYKKEEVIGQNPRVLKSGNQSKILYRELWENLIKGKSWSGEFENRTKDGNIVWVRANISPIFDDDKNIINLLGIQENITESKQTHQLLQYNEKKMRDIFSSMNDMVFQIDKDGVYQYIAPTNSDFFIVNQNELLGKSFYDIFPKENADLFMSYVTETLNSYKSIVKEYSLNINDKIAWFEVRMSPISDDQVIAIIRDITKRAEVTESLKKSELKFRNLFEQSGDAILMIKNGRFFECNQAALDMLGYSSKEQLIFKNPDDISPLYQEDGITSKSKAIKMMEMAINKGSHRFEWYHTKKNGQIFPVEILLTSTKDFDGENIIHTVWRDISDQKKKEKEIIEAKEEAEKADKFKTAFLANMSHEIRTPMNGILGFTELLLDPDLSLEEKEHFVQIIRKSGLNMLNIINDILDVSKIESGEVELNLVQHNVVDTMNYLYDFFKVEIEKKGMQWIRVYDVNADLTINIDQYKLNELLTNLIKNAIKYSHVGQIKMGVQKRKNDLLFFVEDTGIGIPYEKQDKIFDRFIQADNDITHMVYGTGLGLSISKAYVEMHQGEIWLESTPGKGSAFYFTIPRNLSLNN